MLPANGGLLRDDTVERPSRMWRERMLTGRTHIHALTHENNACIAFQQSSMVCFAHNMIHLIDRCVLTTLLDPDADSSLEFSGSGFNIYQQQAYSVWRQTGVTTRKEVQEGKRFQQGPGKNMKETGIAHKTRAKFQKALGTEELLGQGHIWEDDELAMKE